MREPEVIRIMLSIDISLLRDKQSVCEAGWLAWNVSLFLCIIEKIVLAWEKRREEKREKCEIEKWMIEEKC